RVIMWYTNRVIRQARRYTVGDQKPQKPQKPRTKPSRFPLAIPDDVRAAIESYAGGEGRRPPTSLNDAIIFLVREGLKRQKSENEPGQLAAGALAR
ncbi:MAG TPA: hypothetical protein VFT99_03900, partial [Roseiflexaceae bacterium]|nr:hypothetical protein [Roseiflexaceae bacterium]